MFFSRITNLDAIDAVFVRTCSSLGFFYRNFGCVLILILQDDSRTFYS